MLACQHRTNYKDECTKCGKAVCKKCVREDECKGWSAGYHTVAIWGFLK